MITNFETNKVFIAKGLSSIPYTSTAYSLVTSLYNQNLEWGELPYSESPLHIWARDYMPVQVNKDKFVKFNYNPDYLRNYPQYKPDTSKMHSGLDIKVINSDLVVDGGNIISCGDKVIMTDKVFVENVHINRTSLIDTLSHLLEAEIVLIPWDRYEEYGHADGMVRYMGDGNVLINNYCDFDKSLRKKLLSILGQHFCVNELHYGTFTDRSWAYLNFLHVGRHLFIPMLGERLDSIAYGQIAESFPECECHPIINCESVVNEGGALNCCTWNMMSNSISPKTDNITLP
jgi:agmatine/peptidylarginine deiminase